MYTWGKSTDMIPVFCQWNVAIFRKIILHTDQFVYSRECGCTYGEVCGGQLYVGWWNEVRYCNDLDLFRVNREGNLENSPYFRHKLDSGIIGLYKNGDVMRWFKWVFIVRSNAMNIFFTVFSHIYKIGYLASNPYFIHVSLLRLYFQYIFLACVPEISVWG